VRRLRPLIVWLCLVALVGCQLAMAVQACDGVRPVVSLDCHDADAGDDGHATDCPVQDASPALGKLPFIAPLPGHLVFLPLPGRTAAQCHAATRGPGARAGPHLATLCQLLI
jgi:hypothetical protein